MCVLPDTSWIHWSWLNSTFKLEQHFLQAPVLLGARTSELKVRTQLDQLGPKRLSLTVASHLWWPTRTRQWVKTVLECFDLACIQVFPSKFLSFKWYECLMWGWVFLERTRILSGIQFTAHFIEIFVVETKRFVGSFVHVILARQTCGQHSSKAAESKRRALGKVFHINCQNLVEHNANDHSETWQSIFNWTPSEWDQLGYNQVDYRKSIVHNHTISQEKIILQKINLFVLWFVTFSILILLESK